MTILPTYLTTWDNDDWNWLVNKTLCMEYLYISNAIEKDTLLLLPKAMFKRKIRQLRIILLLSQMQNREYFL